MNSSSDSSTSETNIDAIVITLVVLMGLLVLIPVFKKNRSLIQTKIKRLINKNAHVVVVSTYGPAVSGSPFYEAYIAKAITYILDPINKVDEVIIVGGYTVDPNISQSQAVLNYIKQTYPQFNTAGIAVTLDECGITTWQNIKNTKVLMDKNSIRAKKITIFAEESREKKVSYFANATFYWEKDSVAHNKEFALNDDLNYLIEASKEAQLAAYKNFTVVDFKKATFETKNPPVQILTFPSGLSQNFIDEEHAKIFQEIREFYDATFASKTIKAKLDEWSNTAGFNVAENLVKKGCTEYKQFIKQ